MIKCCPIMSNREKTFGKENCIEGNCAFWNDIEEQCCIKTIALAITKEKNIPPMFAHVDLNTHTDAVSTKSVDYEDLVGSPHIYGGMAGVDMS